MAPLVSFHLDGALVSYSGDPDRDLLSWLREDRGITSVKDGCSGQAFCRACTVEIDGRPRLACVTKMGALERKSVTTLEGLPEDVRDVLASAFVRHGAVQCGFCSPGFLARTRILLTENETPTREQVVSALRHNYCRCTGYHSIVEAVLDAARLLRGEKISSRSAVSPREAPLEAGCLSDEGGTPLASRGVRDRSLGSSVPKYRAISKALGDDPFVDDLRFDGMLHGALRFSDHPRARVLAVDATTAASMPGVVDVFLAKDVPGERVTGLVQKDWPLMVAPGEITRYVGDVLALVVAETREQARDAAALIDVKYEVLTPLTSAFEALESDVHIHSGGNLLGESVVRRGEDVGDALAASAFVSHSTYRTQRVEHAFLEVEAAVAMPWDRHAAGPAATASEEPARGDPPEEGGLEVFTSSQGVYIDRSQIAALLGIAKERVKVTQVAAGGAFGGKEDLSVQGHAALAAWILGRPVKVRLDRADSIRMHPKRHPMVMEYAVGCDEVGKLTAVRARITGDTGAYASVGQKILERAAGHAAGAYHVPAVDVVARSVHTNNLPCGAMRGFGVNQVVFAMESCLDDLCEQGGFDRWQIRYDNAITDGGMTTTGQVLEAGVGLRETLLAVKEAYEKAPFAGIACGIKNCGVGNGRDDTCEVEIEVAPGPHVTIKHGWTEMGQGVHTMALQLLAESTGIDPEIVDVVVSTEDEAEAGMTTSSRGTSLVGNAIIVAARDLRRDLTESDGRLERLAGRRYRGRWTFDRSTAPGAEGDCITHYSYSYATQLVVLTEDGEIDRVVAAHDAGRIINPALFRGQIEGSVHMGLGYALSEELPQEDAGPPPMRLKDLGLIPMDRMPPVDVTGVEVPDPLGPYGAKGVGEIGLVPTAAAVASAYRSHDGRPRRELPLRRNMRRK